MLKEVENATARRQPLLAARACGLSEQIFVREKQDRINSLWCLTQKAEMGERGHFAGRAVSHFG